jgi:hypothetical protein
MRIGFRNTYANVAATAALVLTLSGTGYAASTVRGDGAGAAGGLPGTLASGKTLTGSWGQSAEPATSQIQTDTISFPVRLSKPVAVHVRQQGAGPSRNCPGTPSAPKARKGHLCIYVGAGANHDPVDTYSPVDGAGNGNYKFGAVVYWRPQSADFVYASGTWAVTAK